LSIACGIAIKTSRVLSNVREGRSRQAGREPVAQTLRSRSALTGHLQFLLLYQPLVRFCACERRFNPARSEGPAKCRFWDLPNGIPRVTIARSRVRGSGRFSNEGPARNGQVASSWPRIRQPRRGRLDLVKAFTLLLNRSERRSPRPSRRRSFREGHPTSDRLSGNLG